MSAMSSIGSKPVVVTRPEAQDGPLSSQLRGLGLTVLNWAAIQIMPTDSRDLDEALQRARSFDWVVFASRHAVDAVVERLPEAPAGVRIAAVGPATAQLLRECGWPVDVMSEEGTAAALVEAFARHGCEDARVLYPASSRALPTLAEGLTRLGAKLHQVEAYRTEPTTLDVEECRTWIARDGIAAVTFASPSAVIELERALGKPDFDRLLTHAGAIVIGPTTGRVIASRGYTPVYAESPTLPGLASATYQWIQSRCGPA